MDLFHRLNINYMHRDGCYLGKLPVPVGQRAHPFFRLLRNEGGTPNSGRGWCQRKIRKNRKKSHAYAPTGI